MKKLLLFFCSAFTLQMALAQQMGVKHFNFTTFREDVKFTPPVLSRNSSAEAKANPEYGILPYNAQCTECVELIDKRTLDTRFYIDPKKVGHTYSQSSYFPLHYKSSKGDMWHTIDRRLRPVAGQPGVYEAKNQPVPTILNMNSKTTKLDVGEMKFEFNKDLTLYFFDENTAYTRKEKANYSNYTVGEEGLKVKNLWQGIEMQQVFRNGEIETDYIINEPLQLPITTGWMVVEDHFTLPDGYSFEEESSATVSKGTDGQYKGSYQLKNSKGETLVTYKRPVYVDAKAIGMHGGYKLQKDGSNYTLQMYIPVDWILRKDNIYPLTIDPRVIGVAKRGDFHTTTGGVSAGMGFSDERLYGSCNDHIFVTVPGNSILDKAYVDLEYHLTYDNTCGNPPLPIPFCTYSMVSQEVICDTCQTSSGRYKCGPANPPFTGTCTTDSLLVPGARSVEITKTKPEFLACIPRQCGDYQIGFTLMNRDSVCTDSCGYLCAVGDMWQMTIEGFRDSLSAITVKGDTLFSGYITGNQWVRNDTVIPGATGQFYVVTEPGTYLLANAASQCFIEPIDISCMAKFDIHPDNEAPGEYYGYNTSFGNNIICHWDFGDGDTSNERYPIHVYAQPGRYTVCLTVQTPGCTSTYCDSTFYVFKTEGGLMSKLTIRDKNAIGIKETGGTKASLTVFPNPAKNLLTVKASNFQPQTIVLYDARGRKISEQKFAAQLDIAALTPGVYFIEVKGEQATVRKNFVKE